MKAAHLGGLFSFRQLEKTTKRDRGHRCHCQYWYDIGTGDLHEKDIRIAAARQGWEIAMRTALIFLALVFALFAVRTAIFADCFASHC
jgi:hypothetical protein